MLAPSRGWVSVGTAGCVCSFTGVGGVGTTAEGVGHDPIVVRCERVAVLWASSISRSCFRTPSSDFRPRVLKWPVFVGSASPLGGCPKRVAAERLVLR